MAENVKNSQKQVNADGILDKIIALTFTRHANLSESEFLQKLGLKEPKDEDTEVRNARFALISACMREMLRAVDKLKLITQVVMLGLDVKEEDLRKGDK